MADVTETFLEAERLRGDGNLEAAAAKYEEALALDPRHILAHSALAVTYGKLGRHEDAVKHAAQVCEIDPTDPFHFTALSMIYQRAWAGTNNHAYIKLAEDAMARAKTTRR